MVIDRFWSFCSITGELSISNKRYEPPCKSKPRFIFLSNKSFVDLNRFDDAKKIKKSVINETKIILSLEKYNTLFQWNLFFNFLRIH